MKQLILLAALFFSFSSSGQQLITLFEAGEGAPQGVSQGFSGIFSFGADLTESHFYIYGTAHDTLGVLFYNETSSGANLWITQRIPQMEQYTQLEFFADLTLPSDAEFDYLVSTDSSNWDLIPNSAPLVPIAFDNSAGYKFLQLSIRLNSSDSVYCTYNYISVKADPLSIVPVNPGISVLPDGLLNVAVPENEPFTLSVFTLSAEEVFTTSGTGPQTIDPGCENGLYIVTLTTPTQQWTVTCYLQ